MDPRLGTLQLEITDSISDLDSERLTFHEPGQWCIGEILEHLYWTYTGTIKGCMRLLESGKPQASRASLKNVAQSMIVVGLGYMPAGRKSPAGAQPRGLAAQKVAKEIEAKITEMDGALTECAARFGVRVKVLDHPVLGPFSIEQWRKFHLVHGRHHVKQIRRRRAQAESKKLPTIAV
jgi:hypothetical protein